MMKVYLRYLFNDFSNNNTYLFRVHNMYSTINLTINVTFGIMVETTLTANQELSSWMENRM
jgi:hypothetical protein